MVHRALYGSVEMVRGYCHACRSWALVIDGSFGCCGRAVAEPPTKKKRMSLATHPRRHLSSKQKAEIVSAQENRCLYCGKTFGGWIEIEGEIHEIRPVFDHVEPHIWSNKNNVENFIAACGWCNSWKSSLHFKSLEEIQVYVAIKWDEELRGVRNGNEDQKTVATVLLDQVPVESVDQGTPKSWGERRCQWCGADISRCHKRSKHCSVACQKKQAEAREHG